MNICKDQVLTAAFYGTLDERSYMYFYYELPGEHFQIF